MPKQRATKLMLVAMVAWSARIESARAGTYGTYRESRAGYSVAHEINIGSYSDHAQEGPAYARAEARLAAQLKPLLSVFDAWFARVVDPAGAYEGWLGALDRRRVSTKDWDYKNRMPAPVPAAQRAAKPDDLLIAPTAPGVWGTYQIYLHMKADATLLAQGRALVGFALAQAQLGDSPAFTLTEVPREAQSLSARLRHLAGADSYAGQPSLLASAVLESRARRGELARIASDTKEPAHVRLLARWLRLALEHKPFADEDWRDASKAARQIDARTLWTWALVLHAEADESRCDTALRRHVPLGREDLENFTSGFRLAREP